MTIYVIHHFMLPGHERELHYRQTSSGGEFYPGSHVRAHRKGRQYNINKGMQALFFSFLTRVPFPIRGLG